MTTTETTLSQWVGIRKGTSQKATSAATVLHRDSQKAGPYNGFSKAFRPKDEDGEVYPAEKKKVTQVASQILEVLAETETDWMDVVATCDYGNTVAKASVEVDGRVLVKDASVPFLLFLEKRLVDLRTFVEKMPTLDATEDWTKDPNSDLFKTDKITTHKTKKVQRAIVKYDAVVKDGVGLPAQTEMITEDVVIGWWDTVKMSGAIPGPRQRELVKRITKLLRAVKFAMSEANSTKVEKVEVGEIIYGFLFE